MDHNEAARWYRLAADQGYGLAQARLGDYYSGGEGVVPDYAAAGAWYQQAANRGYAAGMAGLGSLYATGRGVRQDTVQAYMWLQLAAGAGDWRAAKKRDVLAGQMKPGQIAEAQKLAHDWQPPAAGVN